MGQRQTVQIKIRHSVASDHGLHCLLTESSIGNLIQKQNKTLQPLKRKWTGLIDNNWNLRSAYMG